ncbi:MAG: TolC family protein [Thiobacillus sp.]|nr:TolC family protein [Thiobacillus sp.]
MIQLACQRALWLTALVCLPAGALMLDDPFDTARGVSPHYSVAKDQIATAEPACQFDAPGDPLEMQEAVARALCHDPETRKAWALALSRAAETGQALGSYLPQLSSTLDYTRNEQDYERSLGTTLSTTTRGYSLRLNWLLLDLGRRNARLLQARALLDAANANHDGVLQQTFLAVLQTYFDSQRAYASWRAASDAEKFARFALEAATARHHSGVASLADKLMAASAASRATAERIQAEHTWRKSQGTLAARLGLSPDTVLNLPDADRNGLKHDAIPTYEELSNDTINQHPTVRAAAAEVIAAEQRVRFARAEHRPALAMNGQYVHSPAPSNTAISPDSVSSIGVQLSIPLFQGFEPHYKVRNALAELEARRAALEAARRQVRLGIWTAYQDWLAARKNRIEVETLSSSVEKTLRATEARYRAGIVGISEWLDAQRTQAETQRLRVDAEANWRTARIALAASMGQIGTWIFQ